MPNFVAVNKTAHKDIKVLEDQTFAHAKSQHMTPLLVHEFPKAAHEYPIIFVKNVKIEKYIAVAVFGLQQEENLFYDENGWKARYKPESIQGYPFVLTPHQNDKDRHILVMDEESNRLSTEQGHPLFDEKGEQTEFVTKLGSFLTKHLARYQATQEFIQVLLDYKLMVHQILEISSADKSKTNIDGMYVVSEEALGKLSDKDYLDLRKRGFLPSIYASLFSLSNIGGLIQMVGEKNKK